MTDDEEDTLCTVTGEGRQRSLRVPSVVATVTRAGAHPVEARLDLHPLVVGTAPDCGLVVFDPQVSRRHCELSLTRHGIVLRDLGSKNGTRLGDVSIKEGTLPAGVTVTIGESELVLRAAGVPTLRPMSAEGRFGDAVGSSFPMRALFAALERVAPTDQTLLLRGESGTGKEVLARAIHAGSARRDGPFVVFDCGAVTPTLVESELFGHARGAFTGALAAQAGLLEQADGGTLFIDEIGELPIDLQPKLLRALEARQTRRVGATEWKPFDARIVAATHRDLRAGIAAGSFREDLYYRIAVVEVWVPALRDRKDDIPVLIERFLAARTPRRTLADLPAHAMSMLASHDWPGNVRELRNVVERLMLFPELAGQALGPLSRALVPAAPAASLEAQREALEQELERSMVPLLDLPFQMVRDGLMERIERKYLEMKLCQHDGNVTSASEDMGVSRNLVYRLLDRYGIPPR
jgi:DNA-binding NtrC family response regulator